MENWGTRSPINIEFPGLPGGIPIRANGNFVCHVDAETSRYGIRIRDFKVMSFSYPEGVQEKLEQAAGIHSKGVKHRCNKRQNRDECQKMQSGILWRYCGGETNDRLDSRSG